MVSSVPVTYEAEQVYSSIGSTQVSTCGVLNRNGIFYATLKMAGQDRPLEIALHGIRSEVEARAAFATLSLLRGTECAQAMP